MKTLILGIIASMVIAVAPASAVTTTFVDPGDSSVLAYDTLFLSGAEIQSPGFFSDTFTFTLPDLNGTGTVGVTGSASVIDSDPSASSFGIASLAFRIFDAALTPVFEFFLTDAAGNGPPGTQIGTTLAADGVYTLEVSGTALASGGAYNFSVAAVPVPAALPLLAGGLGLLGVFGYRRRRSAASAA